MRAILLLGLTLTVSCCMSCSRRSENTPSSRGAANSQANSASSQTSQPAFTPAPQQTPDPLPVIQKLTIDLGTALSQGNADELGRILSDGYVHINDNGQIVTKPEIVTGVQQGSVRFTSVNIQEVNVRVYGDAAVVNANFIGTNAANGARSEVQDRVTLVAAREGDSWRFVSGQTTRVHPVAQGGNARSGATSNGGILGSRAGGAKTGTINSPTPQQ